MLFTECKRRMGRFLKATQQYRGSWRTDVCIPCRRAERISHHPRSTRLGSNHPQTSGLTPKRSACTLGDSNMLHVFLKCHPHPISLHLTQLISHLHCLACSSPTLWPRQSCLASLTNIMMELRINLEVRSLDKIYRYELYSIFVWNWLSWKLCLDTSD